MPLQCSAEAQDFAGVLRTLQAFSPQRLFRWASEYRDGPKDENTRPVSPISIPPQVMPGTGFGFDNAAYDSFADALDQALRVPPPTLEAWATRLLRRHNWDDVVDRVVLHLTRLSATARPR